MAPSVLTKPQTSRELIGVKHDERMGNLAYCAYCGFGLVTSGLRECSAAGYDVDRLRAALEEAIDWLKDTDTEGTRARLQRWRKILGHRDA